MSARPAMNIELDWFGPNPNRSLDACRTLGVARIRMPDLGLTFRGIRLNVTTDGAVIAVFPRQLNTTTGKTSQMVFFTREGDYRKFSRAVVDAVRAAHPEVFAVPAQQPLEEHANV